MNKIKTTLPDVVQHFRVNGYELMQPQEFSSIVAKVRKCSFFVSQTTAVMITLRKINLVLNFSSHYGRGKLSNARKEICQ